MKPLGLVLGLDGRRSYLLQLLNCHIRRGVDGEVPIDLIHDKYNVQKQSLHNLKRRIRREETINSPYQRMYSHCSYLPQRCISQSSSHEWPSSTTRDIVVYMTEI